MNVIGIDPSYTRTGVATTADTRSLTPPPAHAHLPPLAREAARRAWLVSRLRPLMAGRDLVAVEGLYPSMNYGVIGRAALLGAITDAALTAGAAVLIVAPATIKILATGNGGTGTDKAAMIAAAHTAGFNATNDDTADAAWLAELAHLIAHPNDPRHNRYPPHQLRALDAYRPPYTRDHPSPWVRELPDPATRARAALGG